MQLTNVGNDAPDSGGSAGVSRPSNRAIQSKSPGEKGAASANGSPVTETSLPENGDQVSAVMDQLQRRHVSASTAGHVLDGTEAAELARWATQQMREQPGTAMLAQANLSPRAVWSLLQAE